MMLGNNSMVTIVSLKRNTDEKKEQGDLYTSNRGLLYRVNNLGTWNKKWITDKQNSEKKYQENLVS